MMRPRTDSGPSYRQGASTVVTTDAFPSDPLNKILPVVGQLAPRYMERHRMSHGRYLSGFGEDAPLRGHRASPQSPTRQRGEDTYQPGHGVPVGGRGHLTLPITNKMLPVGGGHDIFGGAVDAEGDDASRSRPARAMNQHAASSGIFQTGGHLAGVFGMGGFGSSGPDGI